MVSKKEISVDLISFRKNRGELIGKNGAIDPSKVFQKSKDNRVSLVVAEQILKQKKVKQGKKITFKITSWCGTLEQIGKIRLMKSHQDLAPITENVVPMFIQLIRYNQL